MSHNDIVARGKVAAAAAQRDRSLMQLLDPSDLMPGHTIADLYSLRHLSLQGGIPDSPPWLRAQAWKVFLGYLPPEKKEWSSVLHKRRQEYYRFVSDLSPADVDDQDDDNGDDRPSSASTRLSERDVLLDQIYKDLSRSRKNGFAFYQNEVRPSRSCPLAPRPESTPLDGESSTGGIADRVEARHVLLRRLALINAGFAEQIGWQQPSRPVDAKDKGRAEVLTGHTLVAPGSGAASAGPARSFSGPEGTPMSPPIYLSPPSPGGTSTHSSQTSFAAALEAGIESQQAAAASSGPDPGAARASEQPGAGSALGGGGGGNSSKSKNGKRRTIVDRNWHSLLRILYFHALLNPSIGYVQGMNEALFTLFYAFGIAGPLPQGGADGLGKGSSSGSGANADADFAFGNDDDGTSPHAEADAFWCFSLLIGEVKELYDFEGVDRAISGSELDGQPRSLASGNFLRMGMAGALKRFSLRLKWLEPELWRTLRSCNLDPRMPYYSFRWLACLVSTELSLPSVLWVWDALLSEQETSLEGAFPAKIEFLIDVCCALLIQVKPLLPDASDEADDEDRDAFSQGMRVLQAYPDEDVGPVIEMAVIFRQRRLASDLTGDGPPEDDVDNEAEAGLASVRARAAQTLQRWGKSASPQAATLMGQRSVSASGGASLTPAKGGSWFGSMGRSFSGGRAGLPAAARSPDDSPDTSRGSSGWASATSTPSRPSVGGVFQRYAEALQSSDAAANFSKASTNLTAKALASFGGSASRETSQESSTPQLPIVPAKIPSLGAVGASFFKQQQKARSGSDGSNAIMRHGLPQTPEMARWSRDTMPDFPLPDVSDSPAGRTEYTDSTGKRMSLAYSHINGRQAAIGSPSLSDPHSEGGFGSLPLPSLRAAAKLGLLPRSPRDSPSSVRGAGPKPLLLRQSARPPREGSSNGLFNAADEPSRKVSSGPLAHAQGPGSRSASRTGRDSSMAGSLSNYSSRSPSEAGSVLSAVDSPDTSMASHTNVDHMTSLPSLNGTSVAAIVPIIPPELANINPLSTVSGPIGLMGNGDGTTVPAGAFAKVRAAAAGQSRLVGGLSDTAATDATGNRGASASAEPQLKFGDASSSSDVALVSASSIGTAISRPRPAAAAGSASNSLSGSLKSSRATSAAFSTTSTTHVMAEEGGARSAETETEPDSWLSSEGVELSDAPMPMPVPAAAVALGHEKRESIFEKPRAAPRPPPVDGAAVLKAHTEETADATEAPLASPTRYELYDEPIRLLASPPAATSAASIKTRTRSGSAIVRSKRFTKNRTSSTATPNGSGSISRNRRPSSSRLSDRASKPSIVLPLDTRTGDVGSIDEANRPPPSPGPGVGDEISTSELLDQLTSESPEDTDAAPFVSLQRPSSYVSAGSHSRSSAEGQDLLSDDMFAAPTTSFIPGMYHERPDLRYVEDGEGSEREREDRRISVPLSSTGSVFGNGDGGLEAIGSSLAFPESDVEDAFEDLKGRRDEVGVL